MVYALADYCRYRRRAGRFARDLGNGVMGGAFEGSIPDAALQQLNAGDIILVGTLNKFTAWVIMYLTQSEVSHVAMYLGDRRICHAMPNVGVVIESVDVLFHPDARLLPCICKMPDEKRSKIAPHLAHSWVGRPYAILLVVLKGLNILSGRNWPVFRWKFALDVLLLFSAVGLAGLTYLRTPIAMWTIPAYAVMVLFNGARWRIHPPKRSTSFEVPIDALGLIVSSGGACLLDGIAVQSALSRRREIDGKRPAPRRDVEVLRVDFFERSATSFLISAERAAANAKPEPALCPQSPAPRK